MFNEQETDTLQTGWLLFGEIEMENPESFVFQNILMTPNLDRYILFR